MPIRRPQRAPAPVQKDGPRINDEIRNREVQLINAEGTNLGVIDIQTALKMATDAGLDLVEISPNNNPPVCKILDFGKYKFQAQKKAAEARKRQKVVEIKEIKLRPMIDDHDYGVKMRAMQRFFEEGDKVKVTLRFRGREMAHQELGTALAQSRQGRHRQHRQGRAGPALRRPPGGDGAGAALSGEPYFGQPKTRPQAQRRRRVFCCAAV